MIMAVSHGHSTFATNWCSPREASNSSSDKSSSLNDSSCSNIASHSSSSEMCWEARFWTPFVLTHLKYPRQRTSFSLGKWMTPRVLTPRKSQGQCGSWQPQWNGNVAGLHSRRIRRSCIGASRSLVWWMVVKSVS